MSKLWGGRFETETNKEVERFSTSIATDQRLWSVDIQASIAHARGLGEQGIILKSEADQLIAGLQHLHEDLVSGKQTLDPTAEDIHSDIEKKLTAQLGSVAGKLHTARSRNDQVATDTRLYLREEVLALEQELRSLQKYFLDTAGLHTETILPGFTHLQHAQPVSLAHHLLAYFWMLQRDRERIQDSLKRINSLPLGSAALAGTGFNLDRKAVAKDLQFSKVTENSLDAVSDRDFVIEFLSNGSLIMMHLSRISEELILWSTPEFAFVQLGDEVTTGSSIMPQKKNPDVAELIRGRVGRLYGSLMGALTMLKGLPLSYNRDLQEDKVFLFEGLDTVRSSVRLMLIMLEKATWKTENMKAALRGDFSNATDLADDLVKKGLPFREAHEVIGRIVNDCLKANLALEDISLAKLREFSPLFDEKSLEVLPHLAVMKARTSEGGTAPTAVLVQIEKAEAALAGL
jgi:argininosuccinate lyase